MKKIILLAIATVFTGFSLFAADPAPKPAPKPDKLETCPVTDEKLGSMGNPYVFTYQDQEVKLCCKGCKKDFDKDPAKYIAKIRAADKKADKK